MHVLDTDAVIEILRKTPAGVDAAERYPDAAITAITVFEIVRGTERSGNKAAAHVADDLLRSLVVLDFGALAARKTAALYTELEKAGEGLDFRDAAIAGICVANNAVLVTHNVKHFERIRELSVEKW